MQKSDSIKELAAALAKAQGEIKGASKSSTNPFYHSKYADLSEVWDACREPLAKNGLAVIQSANSNGDVGKIDIWRKDDSGAGAFRSVAAVKLTVVSLLAHSSGEWYQDEVSFSVENDPQSIGKAISYMRRYQLASMVGVYQEDDDAEGAMGRKSSTQTELPPPSGKTDSPGQQQQDAKDHWCSIHNCKYYKNEGKDGAVWYSHKVKETGKYCNEPKLKEEPKEDAIPADEFKAHLKTLGYPTQKAIIELLQAANWESVKAVYPTHEAILDAVSEAAGIPWRALEELFAEQKS
jgi:hypothetical protein